MTLFSYIGIGAVLITSWIVFHKRPKHLPLNVRLAGDFAWIIGAVIGLCLFFFLAGCSAHRVQPQTHGEVPPPPALVKPAIEVPPEVEPELIQALEAYERTKKAPVVKLDGLTLYPYKDGFTVNVKYLRMVDVQFAEGERLTKDVIIGDPEAWKGHHSISGEGEARREHLALSPQEKGSETDVLIYSNYGVYALVAHEGKQGPTRLGMWSPQDVRSRITARNIALAKQAEQQHENPRPANQRYTVSGDDVAWMPEQVIDDGTRVYIRFRPEVRTSTMPLLYITEHGEKELVNYATQWPYIVVSQLFTQAELVSGVGRQQQRVTIERND